jgi:hypothetical protein
MPCVPDLYKDFIEVEAISGPHQQPVVIQWQPECSGQAGTAAPHNGARSEWAESAENAKARRNSAPVASRDP